jgi:hypothetical protein
VTAGGDHFVVRIDNKHGNGCGFNRRQQQLMMPAQRDITL